MWNLERAWQYSVSKEQYDPQQQTEEMQYYKNFQIFIKAPGRRICTINYLAGTFLISGKLNDKVVAQIIVRKRP